MRHFLLPAAVLPGPVLAQAPAAVLPEAGAGLAQVLLGLGAVLLTLLACLWLLRRLAAPRAGGGLLRIVAAAAVGPRERVLVVEVEETWLVVGVAPGQVTALHRLPRGRLPAPAAAPAPMDFRTWLARLAARGENAR